MCVRRNTTLHHWIRFEQRLELSVELNDIRRKITLKSISTLKSLNPFLDSDHLKLLIVRREHNLHSDLNVTITILGECCWIIHGRSTIKRIIHQCVHCYSFRPLESKQIMANLQPSQTTVWNHFKQCGVGYAVPFTTRLLRGQTHVYTNSYPAFFICLVTKPGHLEVVNDLVRYHFFLQHCTDLYPGVATLPPL